MLWPDLGELDQSVVLSDATLEEPLVQGVHLHAVLEPGELSLGVVLEVDQDLLTGLTFDHLDDLTLQGVKMDVALL